MTDTVAGPALQDMLSQWLPRQRWFPGRGIAISDLSIVSDVPLLSGDPQLHHLIIEVVLATGPARFQVLVGTRTQPGAAVGDSLIGTLPGLVVYDALHDPELAAQLVRGIAQKRAAGPLRFVSEAGAPLADLSHGKLLTGEQSNTSLVFGNTAILKVLRRLFPGANPDLEVADALARLGSDRVAAPYGWIETEIGGEPVLLAVLSEYLAGAQDGWTLATEGLRSGMGEAFVGEAHRLGLATAQLHSQMATAFGSREMTSAELAAFIGNLHSKLTAAVAIMPELGVHAGRIAAAYSALSQLNRPVMIQRVHGDYHLGQVMRSQHGWVALDFEGEPAAPLAERRAMTPALRDVAGMLRSFDYAARHQLVGHPERRDFAAVAGAWVAQCQDAFCSGYAEGGGADPSDQATLLHALTLEKAVYEVIYEYRHRPTWLSIPLDFVAAA